MQWHESDASTLCDCRGPLLRQWSADEDIRALLRADTAANGPAGGASVYV